MKIISPPPPAKLGLSLFKKKSFLTLFSILLIGFSCVPKEEPTKSPISQEIEAIQKAKKLDW